VASATTTRRRTKRAPARRRAPDDKRVRIVDVATRLFAHNGFKKTTTAEIAREAGVSEGIVFHHFRNKRGVLTEVAAEHGRGVARAMFEGLMPGEEPDVHRMLLGVFRHAEANSGVSSLLRAVEDPADHNSAQAAVRQVIIGALAAAFETWAQQGYINTERPKLAASLLFGMVEYALFECFADGEGENWREYHAECVQLIEAALRMPPE